MPMVAVLLVVVTEQHGNAQLYDHDEWSTGMFILRLAGVLNERCEPACTGHLHNLIAKELYGS
jgi:hypothetical protein